MTETTPFLPDEDSQPDEPTPWGFRITLVLVGVYLAYRLGQGVVWLWNAVVG
jgi:hypothetical protein